ncbi:Tetratricopeptide-like helical [Penicillium vulpinum]|nr:Tetratricopeptide-like helical [Penicillium vulpinum]KAJ5950718.1 Tetratricopeptide-like helical [Penicillium vulpinum]
MLGANDTFSGASFYELDPLAPDNLPEHVEKDLSFLLRHSNFHPLSHLDIPPPLRSEFLILNPGDPLSTTLGTLEQLLAEGRFLIAAHFSASILTSSLISPTDIKIIFSLFYTRLACLDLSGNTILAAQESKNLEDLSSVFYYIDLNLESAAVDNEGPEQEQAHTQDPRHIVPWPLRVLAVRLQSIGFGDSRRSIGGLYEIGLEARREVMRTGATEAEREVWRQRLADLGIRSVNSLIEMGDFDAARRSLDSLRVPGPESDITKLRKALLLLRIGDLDAASQVFSDTDEKTEAALLKPLISMSDGRFSDAVAEWRILAEDRTRTDGALVAQNLAVCLLYIGQLDESRRLLEAQISSNQSFGSLIFNLSTVYELCTDRSTQMKGQLADMLSKQPVIGQTNLDRPNSDLKL